MNLTNRTINARQHQSASFQQAQNAALQYTINYSHIAPDTISASTWSANGANVSSEDNTDATTTAKLSGSPGRYQIVNKITTAAGMIDERIISLTITRDRTIPVPGDYQ